MFINFLTKYTLFAIYGAKIKKRYTFYKISLYDSLICKHLHPLTFEQSQTSFAIKSTFSQRISIFSSTVPISSSVSMTSSNLKMDAY